MELQHPEVLGFGAAPWKSKISVDDSLVAQHRVSCFEDDNMKNYVAYKYKRSSEDDADSSSSSLSSPMLLVWSGQPNEDDDDDDKQPSKRLKPLCNTLFNLNLNKDDGELEASDRIVGWPPIESWRKKLVYQNHGPDQQRHENNARRAARKENGISNMIPLLPRKVTKKMRAATTQALS